MLDKTATEKKVTERTVTITAPNIRRAKFRLEGTAPYMQSRFTKKAMEKMMATQRAGSQAKSKRVRDARNFEADYEEAKHISSEGWCGVPAGAFRTAIIDVCRLVGFKMTLAKLSVFIVPDGFDVVDGVPLVRLHGTPEMNIAGMRNDNGGLDLRARPLWRKWHLDLIVEWDDDQFSMSDISNLLARVGIQCGIGEGRPNSRDSTGIGFGTFKIVGGK